MTDQDMNDKTFLLKKDVFEVFQEYIKIGDFSIETGGILVGELKPMENAILVTDISKSYEHDRKSRYRFTCKAEGHQEFMDDVWRSSGYKKMYLGEWHTHDQAMPIPSLVDRKTWKKIAGRSNNSPMMVFVIVGTNEIGMWTINKGALHKISYEVVE